MIMTEYKKGDAVLVHYGKDIRKKGVGIITRVIYEDFYGIVIIYEDQEEWIFTNYQLSCVSSLFKPLGKKIEDYGLKIKYII